MDDIPKLPIVAAMEALFGESYRECMERYMSVTLEERIELERAYLESIQAYNAAKAELEKPISWDGFNGALFDDDPFREMREQMKKQRIDLFRD